MNPTLALTSRLRPCLSVVVLALFLAVGALAGSQGAQAADPPASAPATDADEDLTRILTKLDDLWRGDSSQGTMTMHVKTKHWERSLTMEMWSKGKEKTLIKVLKPLKEQGSATLKIGQDIYTYLPKTDRTIKLTSAMMGGSWMGSHFTNDDLVKEERMSEDYSSALTFKGEREGKQVLEITMTPKPDAAVVWGKVVATVRGSDDQPLRFDYYDEEGELARSMTFDRYEVTGGRLMPMVMRMIPADKPGEFTEITYDSLVFNVAIADSFFSLSALRR
jgi:outer membrane lipoprotein-sorting protein